MIDFRSVRDTRASAFDFIQVRIASRPSNRPKRCSMYTASSVNRSANALQSPDAVMSRTFAQ